MEGSGRIISTKFGDGVYIRGEEQRSVEVPIFQICIIELMVVSVIKIYMRFILDILSLPLKEVVITMELREEVSTKFAWF